ncbi:hypothetical protein TrST_g9626 [Triparma strigata]|uniref:PX domain-containing protein n=1 Tax=Triparma strigata TaxID=1606541 RepID=A0A9W7DWB6_9STRA|nr:hypothetical protein TrST_g9626 [Triparma strigata]
MSARSTALGDEVLIDVGQQGPYGALLRAGPSGNAAVLVAWERLPNGKFGPIQRDGGVRLGDILVRLNNVELYQRRFEDVMTMLRNPGILNKRLTFVSKEKFMETTSRSAHANLMKSGTGSSKNSSSPSNAMTNSGVKQSKPFMSVVRRARINQDGPSPFAEYEVSCSLRVSSRKVETERVVRWSVWKRYSEFESLDKAIRADFGWQLEAKAKSFPSKNTFTFSKLSVDFVEKRRSELDAYWQAMLSVDRIADFSKSHHCSSDLRAFLEVARHVNGAASAEGGGEGGGEGGEQQQQQKRGSKTSAAANASARRRRGSARPSSMRVKSNRRGSNAGNSQSPTRGGEGGGIGAFAENDDDDDNEGSSSGGQQQQVEQPQQQGGGGGGGGGGGPPPEDLVPFLKMLKMGIPRPAVEMKMGMAGIDAGQLDKYVDGGGGGGGGGLPPPPKAQAAAAPPAARPKPAPAPAPAPSSAPRRPPIGGMSKGLLGDIAKNRID